MNSGRLLVNGNDFYIGNGSSQLSKIAREDQIPSSYTHPTEIQCNASFEINNLKSSVSNGKSAIASAITGKGVSTASNATFQTMANNINSIVIPKQYVPVNFGNYQLIKTDSMYGTATSQTEYKIYTFNIDPSARYIYASFGRWGYGDQTNILVLIQENLYTSNYARYGFGGGVEFPSSGGILRNIPSSHAYGDSFNIENNILYLNICSQAKGYSSAGISCTQYK